MTSRPDPLTRALYTVHGARNLAKRLTALGCPISETPSGFGRSFRQAELRSSLAHLACLRLN